MSVEYGPHTLIALIYARLTRTTFLIFKEHSDSRHISRGRVVYRRVLTRLADGTLANTIAARRDVETVLRGRHDTVHPVSLLVPPTVDWLTQSSIDLTLAGARPIFLFAGGLVEVKNVTALVRASALLAEESLDFAVWVVGDGPLRGRLTTTVSRLGLSRTVIFHGPVQYNAMGHFYAACDVFVMPSLRDYRSVAVLEAMRFGKAIIDSKRDGNAHDTVRENINGFIVDPHDVSGLASAMRRFIADPNLAAEFGRCSEATMVEATPVSAARDLESVLSRLSSTPLRNRSGHRVGPKRWWPSPSNGVGRGCTEELDLTCHDDGGKER